MVKFESICRQQINVFQNLRYGLVRVENAVENRDNAGNRHFLFFSLGVVQDFFLGFVGSRNGVFQVKKGERSK